MVNEKRRIAPVSIYKNLNLDAILNTGDYAASSRRFDSVIRHEIPMANRRHPSIS